MKFIRIKDYLINLDKVIWIGLESEFITFNFGNAALIEINYGIRNGGTVISYNEFMDLKEKLKKLEDKKCLSTKK